MAFADRASIMWIRGEGGGGKEVKTWEMGTCYMTSGLKSTTTVHFSSRFVYIIPTQTPLYKHSPCFK